MGSVPKGIVVLPVGLTLSLGLSTVAQTEILDRRQGGQVSQLIDISGKGGQWYEDH
ncbi:MAG: hypothetical protein ABIU05_07995 [Nitrospirales bacterium]